MRSHNTRTSTSRPNFPKARKAATKPPTPLEDAPPAAAVPSVAPRPVEPAIPSYRCDNVRRALHLDHDGRRLNGAPIADVLASMLPDDADPIVSTLDAVADELEVVWSDGIADEARERFVVLRAHAKVRAALEMYTRVRDAFVPADRTAGGVS